MLHNYTFIISNPGQIYTNMIIYDLKDSDFCEVPLKCGKSVWEELVSGQVVVGTYMEI